MSDRKNMLNAINERILRKKKIAEKVASRNNNVESFVLDLINEVDDMTYSTANPSLIPIIAKYYISSMHERMKVLDTDVNVAVSWQTTDDGIPRIVGILIKWSPEYQDKYKCEPELFVDPVSLIFK